MERLIISLLGCSALLLLCCTASTDPINNDLVNTKVQTTINLTSHLPKVSNQIHLENTGKTSIKSFLFTVDPTLGDKLSFIGAVVKSGDEDKKLKIVPTTAAGHKDKTFYRMDLPFSVEPGQNTVVEVDTMYSHSLQPYPAEIAQAEKQLVQFTGNSHFYSPYKTQSVTTTVNCASSNIESYTKSKPYNLNENSIVYGAFENLDPFSQKELTVHYENNSPFLTVTQMTRLVEVSHWGNVAIEETVDIMHTGALLKGPFSRYDYQRSQDGISSVKTFKTILPAAARDVYYRDEIGNISTSNLRELDDMVELELRPRFPLFGGWKSHYTVGYNVPSYQYLYSDGDNYMLKMRFVDHIFDDQVIDNIKLIVILPEGSRNIEFSAPYSVHREPDQVHYTYLDTIGRPVVTASKSNLVEQHIQEFKLKYTFPKIMMFQEPFLVVAAFYLLFLTIIIYVRLDFSITKDEARETRLRIGGLVEQVQTIQDCRSALYQSYDDAINKFKSSKDLASFSANRKKIDGDYKQMSGQITGLAAKLKAENSDAAEKVAELQKLDVAVKEQVGLEAQYVEKLVSGRMKKEQYVDVEATVRAKKEELYQKMESLLASL